MQTVRVQRLSRVASPDHPHAITAFRPSIPSNPSDRLHLAAVVLHGAGAIGAYVMSTYCDVLAANQQARVPAAIESSVHNATSLLMAGITEAQAFRAGFPVAQDAPFHTHVWNPYILVASFEWLTAAFAMCTLRHWIREVRERVMIWIAAGAAATVLWYARHYMFTKTDGAEFATAMGIILFPSYAVAAIFCGMYLDKENILDPLPPAEHDNAKQFPPLPDTPDAVHYAPRPDDETGPPQGPGQANKPPSVTRRVVVQGRPWQIPQTVSMLTNPPPERPRKTLAADGYIPIESESEEGVHAFVQAAYEVGFRYSEYVITAPLLFIAVLTLLTVDAPAWLFLAGYWAIQACIATGAAFHATFCSDLLRDAQVLLDGRSTAPPQSNTTPVEWLQSLIANGSWHNRGMQHAYLMECSWICLALPIGGLIYMTRGWISSSDVPAIALIMIWLLIISYTMFGVAPSVVYAMYRRSLLTRLPWILDVLNLASKFPIPILILVAFSTRPAMFHACSA